MLIQFFKMQALGNDFMVFDSITQNVKLSRRRVKELADRNLGVGFDQLLLLEPPKKPEVDFYLKIFNADGSEAAQCGNGVRCVMRYIVEQGLTWKKKVSIQIKHNLVVAELSKGDIKVKMGVPKFSPKSLPFLAEPQESGYDLSIDSEKVKFDIASVGNPHAVLQVSKVDRAPVKKIGPLLSEHKAFPDGVNVGFMQIVGPRHVSLRVFERGVGETSACGSGACAAVAVARKKGLLDKSVVVDLPGGLLKIEWSGDGEPMWMIGPGETVFQGQVKI